MKEKEKDNQNKVKTLLFEKKSALVQSYFKEYAKAPQILQPTDEKKIYKRMLDLKRIVDEPKEEHLDKRAKEIEKHLNSTDGESISYSTVREERWQPGVHCIHCGSDLINKLDKVKLTKKCQYHYQCLLCGHQFYDDTETPFDKAIPPIQIWMQCWYLFGTTQSIEYVATKLNLEVSVVEEMINQLQKLFKVSHPLTRMKKFKDWLKESLRYQKEITEMLTKTSELHGLEATGQAKDTAEYRRQQKRRRGEKPTSGKGN